MLRSCEKAEILKNEITMGELVSAGDRLLDLMIICFVLLAVLAVLFIAYVVYVIRITRRSENKIKQQNETNELLAKEAEDAKEAAAAKSIYLSNMSHDIRTPINGIIGMTDIAMRHADDQQYVMECLRKVSDTSQHLAALVNDVLDMSQIEQGKLTAGQKPLDIRSVLDTCLTIIDGQLMQHNIHFETQFDVFAYPRLLGDELHLRQVLINILGNAVKFTPDGGNIWFRVREQKQDSDIVRLQFEIEDNGTGMSDEFQKSIFEPFSQADTKTTADSRGNGLGMSITKGLVELMGGTLRLESRLDEGSRFMVELPMVIDYSRPEEAVTQEVKSLEAMRILVAEDNIMNMEIMKCILEEDKAEVTVAVNGKEALEYFEQSACCEYDMILMDVMMPVMDGITAASSIRRLPRPDAGTVPIIAMTANAYTEDVKKTLDAGMNLHISKPVDVGQLRKILSRYAR